MRLTFDAPPHHRLKVEEGEYVHGGREFDVADEVAERLLADPHVPVTPLPEADSGEGFNTHEEES